MGGGVVALRVALGQLVAAVARLGLEVPGHVVGSGLQLDALHRERHARGLARAAAQFGVLRAVGSQPVVHVERSHLSLETNGDVQQAHGVGAPGQHYEERLARSDQAALARRGERALHVLTP